MLSYFILISTVGLGYFLLAKRIFDFFSLAFFSSLIYFLPGFFGFVLNPYTRESVDIVEDVYIVMMLVIGGILFGAIVFDFVNQSRKNTLITMKIEGLDTATLVATGMAMLGFMLTVVSVGESLLNSDKGSLLSELNRWIIIWETAASIGAILAYAQQKKLLFLINMMLLIVHLYVGFTFSFAITLICVLTLWQAKKGKQRLLLNNLKLIPVIVFGGMFIFIYKYLRFLISVGNWDRIFELLGDPMLYKMSISESEPFVTQAILNEVMKQNFQVGVDHFTGVLYHTVFFAPELGAKIVSFNELFQPVLFPNLRWGMANNIWAEMWSSGGWLLLILFICLFALVLFWGSFYIRVQIPVLQGGLTILMGYWSFYIHRNDLLFQINLEKRIFLVWIICVIAAIVIEKYFWKFKNRHT